MSPRQYHRGRAGPQRPKGVDARQAAGCRSEEGRVVPSLDRYGRSLQDLINMVAELRERGIGFTSLHENLDTTTPGRMAWNRTAHRRLHGNRPCP